MQICPQTAAFLESRAKSPHQPTKTRQAIDLEAFCAACFVIDLLKTSLDALKRLFSLRFFTKLSTVFVHEVGTDGLRGPSHLSGPAKAAMTG